LERNNKVVRLMVRAGWSLILLEMNKKTTMQQDIKKALKNAHRLAG